MYKIKILILFISPLFFNSILSVNCSNGNNLSRSNPNSTKIYIKADKSSYIADQQVTISVTVSNAKKSFTLNLSCKDEEKCSKVFNCTSNCGTYKFENNSNDQKVNFSLKAFSSGHVILFLVDSSNNTENLDLSRSFVQISIGRAHLLNFLSAICGWIYFVSWSVSFYPQIWMNFKRKSVVGLNFDFIVLNVTGFFFYSIFNLAMYFVESVQTEYFNQNPFSLIPVEANDVVFSVHAFFVSVITFVQCFCIYERENQTISRPSICLLIIFWLIAIISTIVLGFGKLNALIYLNLLSYIKLFISFIKYIPQAYFNYKRKSTVGWSIDNILLDLTGGLFSLIQICLINFNYDDWGNIKGNLTKFGLGLLSISFDFLFIVQHYILYRNREAKEKA